MRFLKIKIEDIKAYNIIISLTSEQDYEMCRFMLIDDLRDQFNIESHEIIVAEGSHCSCYDFDDTFWEFIAYTKEELIKLCNNKITPSGPFGDTESEFYKLVKNYI